MKIDTSRVWVVQGTSSKREILYVVKGKTAEEAYKKVAVLEDRDLIVLDSSTYVVPRHLTAGMLKQELNCNMGEGRYSIRVYAKKLELNMNLED